jgi:hypothetical protein
MSHDWKGQLNEKLEQLQKDLAVRSQDFKDAIWEIYFSNVPTGVQITRQPESLDSSWKKASQQEKDKILAEECSKRKPPSE